MSNDSAGERVRYRLKIRDDHIKTVANPPLGTRQISVGFF